VGVHALPIASSLLPDGVLEVLDVQQEMLDELKRRADSWGVTNVVATQGDAQALPYADRAFDAAYLVGVLGEIPDALAALHELRRVLRPGGRLVICELLIDPDFVSLPALRARARNAGLTFERSDGPSFSYSAVFRLAGCPSVTRPDTTVPKNVSREADVPTSANPAFVRKNGILPATLSPTGSMRARSAMTSRA